MTLPWYICMVEVCESCVLALKPPCSPSVPWAPETAELLLPELKHNTIYFILYYIDPNRFDLKLKKTLETQTNKITFLEGFVDVDLTRDKVLVVLHVGEDAALVDPVVVVGAKEEDGEVTDIVAQALNVGRHQARVADFCRPPPAKRNGR